jgi:hypothetical protein
MHKFVPLMQPIMFLYPIMWMPADPTTTVSATV